MTILIAGDPMEYGFAFTAKLKEKIG